jgi:hypothetical protein
MDDLGEKIKATIHLLGSLKKRSMVLEQDVRKQDLDVHICSSKSESTKTKVRSRQGKGRRELKKQRCNPNHHLGCNNPNQLFGYRFCKDHMK